MTGRIAQIQAALHDVSDADGWLFGDFRGSDPLAYRVLHLHPAGHVTRRWFYWVPARGVPLKLVHRVEPGVLDALPGDTEVYASWAELHAKLRAMLRDARRVAMQYSPKNAIPYIARVDAGTVDLIRGFGVEVVSSADLVQCFEAVWSDGQVASHREAAAALRRIVDDAFDHVGATVRAGGALSEFDLQQYVLSRMRAYGLRTSHPPIAAVNEHSADPHYSPQPSGSAPITPGALVLIDLWAKRSDAGSVYADITWTAYVGATIPSRHHEIFRLVRGARDRALAFVRDRVARGDFPCGWEVDDVCRRAIEEAGYGERFVHRTGHSIGEEVHGNGANIDNFETQDARRLIPRTCFSIEPGIYLPGEFGIRSEIDVYVSEREALVYGEPIQTELIHISV